MPVLPVSVIEPIWAQFSVLLPDHPAVDPTHPLGCHRRRIPDRIVFDQVIAALVHGSGYERIATPACSDRTIRRRLRGGRRVVSCRRCMASCYPVRPHDRAGIGRCGGRWVFHQSPMWRRSGGPQPRGPGQTGAETLGPGRCHRRAAGGRRRGANRHDSPLLEPTLAALAPVGAAPAATTVHLDRGYDHGVTRRCWTRWASPGRSRARDCPHRCRPEPGGSFSECMRG